MSKRTNRRDFLRKSALAGSGLVIITSGCARLASEPAPAPRKISPNEKVNIACIGCGGKGAGEVDDAARFGNLVAMCDVDENRARKKFEEFPDVPKFKDFRVMLEKMDKQIDAVTISTPDHIHAPAAMMAMQMGKHVFVQKPMTHTVHEARLLTETARKYKVATQMGNQGTASDGLRRGVEALWSGVIGDVTELHVWTNRPIWPQGQRALDERKKLANEPKPEGLDWDLWLGPAPKRPYNKVYVPFNWRGWYDWGTGAFGDMACHILNMMFMGLKLGYPTSIEGQVPELKEEVYPDWSIVKYEFPAREGMPPVKFTWYDGGKKPPEELFHGEKPGQGGALAVGTKGSMYQRGDYGDTWMLLPRKDFEGFDYKAELKKLPKSPGHFQEWVEACKGGRPALSNFDYAGFLTEVVVLGCIAQRLPGRKIEWDGPKMRAKNCPEAAALIRKEYPKGWYIS